MTGPFNDMTDTIFPHTAALNEDHHPGDEASVSYDSTPEMLTQLQRAFANTSRVHSLQLIARKSEV